MKKRSKGVIIFAILIILNTFFNSRGLQLNNFRIFFEGLPEKLIFFRFCISIGICFLSILSSIGILLLRDFFRKTALFVAGFAIYVHLVEGTIFGIKAYSKVIEQEAAINAADRLSEIFLIRLMWTYAIADTLIELAFLIALIYFFTRHKVKQQFK